MMDDKRKKKRFKGYVPLEVVLRTSYIQREGLKVRFPDGGVERVVKKASKKGIRIEKIRQNNFDGGEREEENKLEKG